MVTAVQSVEEILAAVKDIPPLPAIIPRVMNVLNDPDSTVVELSEISGNKGRFFKMIAAAARDWDGTNPVRRMGLPGGQAKQ